MDSVQLVNITPMSLWFMVFITIVTGAYKPTYILGPHIVAFPGVQHFYSTLRSLKIDTFATKRSRKHPALMLLGHTVSGDVLINLHWWQMASPIPIGSMYALYMVTFTINIPPMLAYIYHTWILWEEEKHGNKFAILEMDTPR